MASSPPNVEMSQQEARAPEKMHFKTALVWLEPNTDTSSLAWNPERVTASRGFQPAGGIGLNSPTKGIPFPQQQLLHLFLSPCLPENAQFFTCPSYK